MLALLIVVGRQRSSGLIKIRWLVSPCIKLNPLFVGNVVVVRATIRRVSSANGCCTRERAKQAVGDADRSDAKNWSVRIMEGKGCCCPLMPPIHEGEPLAAVGPPLVLVASP
jgi:hypothetical protein